jgi:hypothetical protein
MNQLNYFKETEKKNKGSSEFFALINMFPNYYLKSVKLF